MHWLINVQEVLSINQIFFPQPAMLCGIIPSLFNSLYYPTSCLLMGYNPFNLILLAVSCNNRIWEALLDLTR